MRPALLRFLIGQIQYHPYGILMDGRGMDLPARLGDKYRETAVFAAQSGQIIKASFYKRADRIEVVLRNSSRRDS